MANDMERLARALMAGSPGKQAAGSLDQLGNLLNTEDGQRLLTLLAAGGADTLKTAAQAALRGDEQTAKAAMAKLLRTREGAELAKKLSGLLNQSPKK